jgi:hypothetical protein
MLSLRQIIIAIMPTTVRFVPGRKKNQLNPVVDEYRFTKDRTRNSSTYYKCTLFKDGCKARITLDENNNLASTPPTHSHGSQVAEIQVHKVKQGLKRKAAECGVKMSSFKFYLPCQNSVNPFGNQCVSEFSAQSEFSVGTDLKQLRKNQLHKRTMDLIRSVTLCEQFKLMVPNLSQPMRI